MSKKIAIFLIGLLSVTQLTGCAITDYFKKTEKIARFVSDEKIARAADIDSLKEIKTISLSKDKPVLTFTKSAIAQAKESAYVVPQASGKITSIKVHLGSKVNKGTTLITLGDSLATNISDIQYEAALKGLDIATNSQAITNDTARRSVQAAALGVKIAYESYQNALNAKNNAEDIYDEQYDNAKDGKSDAKDAKNSLEDSLAKLDDTINQLETQKSTLTDTLANLDPADPDYEKIAKSLEEIKTALEEIKSKKIELETALKAAKSGYEQADNGLDLMEIGFEAQQEQLDFAIFAAEKQYEIASKQFEIAANTAELQIFGVQSQLIQVDSAAKIAALSNEEKNIKSPIAGYVTSLQATKDNLVAPGQVVAKIENPTKLSIKTSLNSEEASLVSIGQEVKITYEDKTITGKITALSPSFSDLGNKINLEIEASNPDSVIIPGALIKITFASTPNNRIFVPLNSLRNNDTQQLITVIKDNKAHLQEVKIGEIVGEYVEITSGLTGKETILKTADNFLNEGDFVTTK